MKKFPLLAVLPAACIAVIAMGCGPEKTADAGHNAQVVRINCSMGYAHMLTYIIMKKDLLTPHLPEGVTVVWSGINASDALRDGLVSGDVDISALASLTVITAIERNLPILLLSGNVVVSSGIYSKNPDIQGVDSLPGVNKIYVNSIGGLQSLMMLGLSKEAFGEAGLLVDKFISQETSVTLLAFGNTDDQQAVACGFPNTVKFSQMPGVRLVADLTLYARKYGLGNYYVANQDFYNENPAIIEAFRKAQRDALDFMAGRPDEAAELLAKTFALDAEIIAEEMKTAVPRLEISGAGYDRSAALLYEAGILKEPPKKFSELPNYQDLPKADNNTQNSSL